MLTPDIKQRLLIGITAFFVAYPCMGTYSTDDSNDRSFLFFKKKSKNKAANTDTTESKSKYEDLANSSVVSKGMFNVLKKGKDYYFEIPAELLNRDMLVVNKLVRVPKELNDAGVNRGINSSNQMVRFELDKENETVYLRQSRVLPDADENSAIIKSVHNNYISPIIASIKVEAYNNDSTTTIVKVSDLFNGKVTSLSNFFADINIGTSANNDLSKISSIKSFDNNVYAVSELTTKVVEPTGTVFVTIETGTSIVLLPEKPMPRRFVSPRVGYFSENSITYSDSQQRVQRSNYITRWNIKPKSDEIVRYLNGEIVEPEKPIVFYIDNSTPRQWRPYIRKGIEDWNSAFEHAGFKNAIKVVEVDDSTNVDADDINYSTLTYAASTKSNAMGPSITDPRSGEIIEADIIWWHNVLEILHDWIVVQTGAINPEARSLELPESLLGDAMRFVACHEVGHSLGLRHNMMASAAVPTDSLRSPAYTDKLGGTSASIMDYARFNYVAQPGDGVGVLSPHIGPYDVMAIEYGYRWYGKDDAKEDYTLAIKNLEKYSGDMYRYSEAQDSRDAIDPRALNEDLGDDAVKSATYGIANLKRIVPNIISWTTSGEVGQDYDDASNLYYSIISQWNRYLYHVMANIGGMYIENNMVGDGQRNCVPVDRTRQQQALQFVIDEGLINNSWLFDADVKNYTYLVSQTPNGRVENSPELILKNTLSYILWDLLSDTRIIRMYESELSGAKTFKPTDMMDMLHNAVFASTIAGRAPTVRERSLQKNFIDALIISASKTQGIKEGSALNALDSDESVALHGQLSNLGLLECTHCRQAAGERDAGRRTINFYGKQANRISDAISLKRGELMQIRRLLKSRITSSTAETRNHYEDLVMRINTALDIAQSSN